MKPEQIRPIVIRLNKRLIDTLVKFEPEINRHFWAKNPSFIGIRFLIEKALPLIGRAGDSEIKQLLELSKAAKNYFKLQITNYAHS